MNYVYLADFFVSYSLPTVVIAVIVAIASLIINRFVKKKIPPLTSSYFPFMLAVFLYFAFDMIFISKAFTLKEQTFYAGILSGSLSVIIVSIFNRIKKGKPLTVSQTVLIIEGIISGYVKDDLLSSTAKALDEHILSPESSVSAQTVAEIIKSNSDERLTDDDYLAIAKLILTAVMESSKKHKR